MMSISVVSAFSWRNLLDIQCLTLLRQFFRKKINVLLDRDLTLRSAIWRDLSAGEVESSRRHIISHGR